jgi:hypothetical protein
MPQERARALVVGSSAIKRPALARLCATIPRREVFTMMFLLGAICASSIFSPFIRSNPRRRSEFHYLKTTM